MELVSYDFPVKSRAKDELLIMPLGDIQWAGDEDEIALGMLKRHVQWGVDNGAWFIGMGDYIDTFSPSNRDRLQQATLYDTTKKGLDKLTRGLVEEIYDAALKPSRGRWLGMLEGHHYHQFLSGGTSDMLLAEKLQTRFLGTSAYIRLAFHNHGHNGSVLVWAHHGVGGGQSISAPLNKLAPMMQSFQADIYIMGHFTSKDGKPIDVVEPMYSPTGDNHTLVYRTKILACTGGFLKGYRPGARLGDVPRGGYVEQGMMRPASLGGVLIKVRPRWMKKDGHDLWLPDLGIEL